MPVLSVLQPLPHPDFPTQYGIIFDKFGGVKKDNVLLIKQSCDLRVSHMRTENSSFIKNLHVHKYSQSIVHNAERYQQPKFLPTDNASNLK